MLFFLNFFSKLMRLLPLRLAIFFGEFIGLVFYLFNRKKRLIAYKNLKLAFPNKSTKDIFCVMRRSFINFGVSIIENFIIDRILDSEFVDSKTYESVEEGSVFVGIHSGNWELYNAIYARNNKLIALFQEQKNNIFDKFLNKERAKTNVVTSNSLKKIIKYVKKGYSSGLVVDHGAEDNAPFINFFDQSVPTPKGAVNLAKKFNKKIYPIFGYKENNHHIIKVADPIDPQSLTTNQVLRQINSLYEDFLAQHPDSYMWWYKRFKRKNNLNIIILSDAKVGHLKQSLLVFEFFKELGFTINKKVIEIESKNPFKRVCLEFCALFSGKGCAGCLKCLRFLIKKDVYEKLKSERADFVISTGSTLAPISSIFSNYLGAKSVIVLKPNLPLNKFTLAFIPEHDRTHAENIIPIKGALSVPLDVDKDIDEFKLEFSIKDGKKISVFIGGPLDSEKNFLDNLIVFISKLKDFSILNNNDLLITTSRRTPKAAEELIEDEFLNFKNCECLIIANKANFSFVVGAFLGLSDIVFVTSDSISMVSESLSLKKTTVPIELEDVFNEHHINFFSSIDSLVNYLGYPYKMRDFKSPQYSLFEYNKRVVEEALTKIL